MNQTLVLVVCLGVALCAETDDSSGVVDENTKDVREFDRKGWRAVESYPEGSSGWIPREEYPEQDSEVFPRRRRIRKRKRRPPVYRYNDDDTEIATERQRPRRRRIRPYRQELWDEMTEESPRPYKRRKITPAYDDPREQEDVATVSENANSNVQTTISPNNIEQTTLQSSSTTLSLRALLEQTAALNIGDILQKENITLTELLLASHLTTTSTTTTTTELPESSTEIDISGDILTENTKYQRINTNSEAIKSSLNRNFEQEGTSFENMSRKEKKSFTPRQKHTKIYHGVTNFEVVTEPTTEKRIFVPAHPKYYTSLDYKPDISLFDEQTTYSIRDETTANEEETTIAPKVISNNLSSLKSKLPITNSKINRLLTARMNKEQTNESTKLPEMAVKISIDEVFGLTPKQKESETTEGPFKMKIELENMTEKPQFRSTIAASSKIYRKVIKPRTTTVRIMTSSTTSKSIPSSSTTTTTTTTTTTEEPNLSFEESKEDKSTRLSAKEEIGEILKDPIGRENLSRILKDRNMTIEELIDQRERGSSQVHLADLFHNKNKEPEPKDEPLVGQVIKYSMHNISKIISDMQLRQPKNLFNVSTTTTTTSTTTTSTEVPIKSEEKEIVVTSFPTFKIEIHKDANKTQSFLWRELYPDLFKNSYENSSKEEIGKIITENYLEEVKRLDDIESTYLASSREDLTAEENSFEESIDGSFINIPTGVKSAVLASLAIVVLSLVVFLTIFIVFKWTQKQRKNMNYGVPSLSSRINPILENGPRNLKTFVTETLGRKKNYYKNNLHSMSDSIWENARKPSF